MIDETHALERRSWVDSADGHEEFPIQNLPLCVFAPPGGGPMRGGVAIGDLILDIDAAYDRKFLTTPGAQAARADALNALFAMDGAARRALRRELSDLLWSEGGKAQVARAAAEAILYRAEDCTLALPCRIGDFTDFYAGIHHAAFSTGTRGSWNPPNANYKYVPVAYHSRTSSILPSSAVGVPIRRPWVQSRLNPDEPPKFAPTTRMDFELELGIWIGPGNALGAPIGIDRAGDHIAGYCLLNDVSIRDAQLWEMAPLGPFLCKNLGTVLSPFVVTAEAMAPFRAAQRPRPDDHPPMFDHLLDEADQNQGALAIAMEVRLLTPKMRREGGQPEVITRTGAENLYWTPAQMVAHHTSNGCNLQPGDLFGTGTISGTTEAELGSFNEISRRGQTPLALSNGESRAYLEDGDTLFFSGHCRAQGRATIGFGECTVTVVAATAHHPGLTKAKR